MMATVAKMPPAETTKRLTVRQKKTIAAILSAASYEDAISAAGVCRVTFYSYLKMPHFKAELDRRLNELTDAALGRIKTAAGEAVEILRTLLKSESENVRLRAAQVLVDYTLKARELDLSARLDAIEKRMEGMK